MTEITVGIDVSKNRLDVAVLPSGDEFCTLNDEASCLELAARLKTLNPTLIVLEAAGDVEDLLTGILVAKGLPAVVVNPRQSREFAKATGRLARTDGVGARVLAHFGVAVKPASGRRRGEGVQAVTALITRRRQIIDMLTAERNRLASSHKSVKNEIAQSIDWLESRVKEIDDDLSGFIRAMLPFRRGSGNGIFLCSTGGSSR